MSSQAVHPPDGRRMTPDDPMTVKGQAELIAGSIVRCVPVGHGPGRIIGRILESPDDHAEARRVGNAQTGSIGLAVPGRPSSRESFSPDAASYDGPPPANEMDFIPGPPTLASEARGKNGYGPPPEAEMVAKRADPFQAGTWVVGDVDPQAEVVRGDRADDPDRPRTVHRGEEADAEPAPTGWWMPVDRILG